MKQFLKEKIKNKITRQKDKKLLNNIKYKQKLVEII